MPQNPNDPVRGDLVELDPAWAGPGAAIPVFASWGHKPIDFETGRFLARRHAIVLEDLHHRNGNGCRILMQDGTTGWVNVHMVRRVK